MVNNIYPKQMNNANLTYLLQIILLHAYIYFGWCNILLPDKHGEILYAGLYPTEWKECMHVLNMCTDNKFVMWYHVIQSGLVINILP